MLDAEITGDDHPKKVVLVNNEGKGEGPLNADLIDTLRQVGYDDYAEKFESAPMDADGNIKVEVETNDIGEVIDVLEGEFFDQPATTKLNEMREEHMRAVEAAMEANDDD